MVGLIGLAVLAAAAPMPPAAYSAAVAPVDSCAAFAERAAALPEATPLLRDLFVGGVATHATGETDAAFMDRAVKLLFTRLGDPARLVVRVPAADVSRADPAAGALQLHLPETFETTPLRWGHTERQVAGARLVTEQALRLSIEFPAPTDAAIPLPAADKAGWPANGQLALLGLFEDYGTAATHAAATPTSPASQTSYKLVRLRARCAVLLAGDRVLPGWRFDGWTAAQ